MKLQTTNRVAFESVNSALKLIDSYYSTREIAKLSQAKENLDRAALVDPEYLDAHFYSGVASDLIGKPQDAIPVFERILQQISNKKIKEEVTYNLGVSYYHKYNHAALQKAAEHFLKVLDSTKKRALKLQTAANLAQTYAMWMIPNTSEKNDLEDTTKSRDVLKSIKKRFENFQTYEQRAKSGFLSFNVDAAELTKINATRTNAKGMALMYYSDYLSPDDNTKKTKLEEALASLLESEQLIPNDWANSCDLGSVYWRLSLLPIIDQIKKDEYLQNALEYFRRVIQTLRPGYGFAFYEIGRINRTKGNFQDAIINFDQAMLIPESDRDVGDSTIQRERDRATANDPTFP